MRLVPVIGGAVLTIISIPSYYYAPHFLSQTIHTFVASMMGGNTIGGASMLRQMGYPPMSVIISMFQYLLIGLSWTGIGFVAFGLVTKKVSKPIAVKVVEDEQDEKHHSNRQQTSSKTLKMVQTDAGNEQEGFEVVNNVLTKLETQLKDIKTGYENHKQTIEDEKKNLEQKERERMAKIIAAGEILIKEITPDKFEERVKHYVGLNNESGQPVDLSLLAEKFETMKKMLYSKDKNNFAQDEYDGFRRFLG